MNKILIGMSLLLVLLPVFVSAATYYVDSSIGSDSNSCTAAEDTATPKRTVNGVMSCNPGAGDIVKFKGTFTQTISPNQNGQVLYPFQAIQSVSGSTVTFNTAIAGLDPATDYVTIYNSLKGNSGAFAVQSFSGNTVTVDTSDLPLGNFILETDGNPQGLHGAILRPVHFTAWDKNNPPVWDLDPDNLPVWGTEAQTFRSFNQSVIMVSYLKTVADWAYWSAYEIDGDNNGNCDYHIFDHLEVTNGEGAIGIEFHEFHTNYNIIQHNNFHDCGMEGNGGDEIIYYGNAYHPERHHDYAQIMYNIVGPHRIGSEIFGDGIEIKPSAHYATVWGNEIVGIIPNGQDDSPLTTDGTATVIGNNYIHDINPSDYRGCGISLKDMDPSEPTHGANGAIIINNIIANVKGAGIWLLDVRNVKVLNNVIYKIPKDPLVSDLSRNAGIALRAYRANTENIEIKNNIIQLVDNYGISAKYSSITTDNDYNLIFQTPNAYYNVDQGDHDWRRESGNGSAITTIIVITRL